MHPERLHLDLSGLGRVREVALAGLPWVIAAVVTLAVASAAFTRWRRHQLCRDARYVTVHLPEAADPTGGAQLWSNLMAVCRPRWQRRVFGQPHLAFEITWVGVAARFGFWIPGKIPPGMIEHAVEAAWPGAYTEVGDPFDPLPRTWAARGGELRMLHDEALPLQIQHPTDPLRALMGAASGLAEKQAAAIQVLARPVTGRRARHGHEVAADLRIGGSGAGGHLVERLLPGGGRHGGGRRADPSIAEDIKLITAKAAGPQWEVLVRYGASTEATASRRQHKQWLCGRAHALAGAFAVYTARNRLRRRRRRSIASPLARRDFAGGDLMSVPELAALAHLPSAAALGRSDQARVVAPARLIPTEGIILGDSDAGLPRPVALKPLDARRHVHVLGNNGTGKSTVLINIFLDAIANGRGAVVMDPNGDLAGDILNRLPASAASRTMIIDPDDLAAVPSINPLEGADPDLVVDNVVAIFRRTFEQFWGPRTDDILRSACLTLLRRGPASLVDIPRLLEDDVFRSRCTSGLKDAAGLGGFWSWYESLTPGARAQAVGPLLSKMRHFLLRPFVKAVVGGTRSTVNFSEILDGGICVVRLPKGTLGAETCELLGSFINDKIWQAATARAATPEPDRHDAVVILDEFQDFVARAKAFSERLAQARKYHVGYVLAHQFLSQMPPDLRPAISGEARTKLYFGMSTEDARALVKNVQPHLREGDLAQLANYQAVGRLCVDGGLAPACTLRTRPAIAAVPGRAAVIRAGSRSRYGQHEVDHATTADAAEDEPSMAAFSAGGTDTATVAVQAELGPTHAKGSPQRVRRPLPIEFDPEPQLAPIAASGEIVGRLVPLFPTKEQP